MALRKCPGCKNQVDAESETCPVCGCNPTLRRVRAAVIWGVTVLTVTWVMFHGHLPVGIHH